MSSKTPLEYPKFIVQLLASSSPEILIAERYYASLESHRIQLEYCQLYLRHLDLRKKTFNQEFELQKLREELTKLDSKQKTYEFPKITFKILTKQQLPNTKSQPQQKHPQNLTSQPIHIPEPEKNLFQSLQQQNQPQFDDFSQPNNPHINDSPEKSLTPNKPNENSDLSKPSKRSRRPAQSIHRHWTCPVESCNKKYGSEGSLKHHLKLKHPQINAINIQFHPQESQNVEMECKGTSEKEKDIESGWQNFLK